jgi:hypothetical protein
MVEVAKEVAKPDYLSLVNKSGSGFNVSELVDAIVGSEIEPKRNLQKNKARENRKCHFWYRVSNISGKLYAK